MYTPYHMTLHIEPGLALDSTVVSRYNAEQVGQSNTANIALLLGSAASTKHRPLVWALIGYLTIRE